MRETLFTLFLYVAVALLNSDLAYGRIVAWDFGRKAKFSYVIGHEAGKISATEKTVRIPLKVPKCHEVTAVRVEVENRVSTPAVRYDEDAQVVTISYTLLSTSKSEYDILMKGRMIPGCGGYGQPPRENEKRFSYDTDEDYDQ